MTEVEEEEVVFVVDDLVVNTEAMEGMISIDEVVAVEEELAAGEECVEGLQVTVSTTHNVSSSVLQATLFNWISRCYR